MYLYIRANLELPRLTVLLHDPFFSDFIQLLLKNLPLGNQKGMFFSLRNPEIFKPPEEDLQSSTLFWAPKVILVTDPTRQWRAQEATSWALTFRFWGVVLVNTVGLLSARTCGEIRLLILFSIWHPFHYVLIKRGVYSEPFVKANWKLCWRFRGEICLTIFEQCVS